MRHSLRQGRHPTGRLQLDLLLTVVTSRDSNSIKVTVNELGIGQVLTIRIVV